MNPETLVDRPRRRTLRLGTLLLLVVILVLGYALIREQFREARLQAALAAYRSRSEGSITAAIGGWHSVDWPEGITLEDAIDRIKSVSSKWNPPFPKGIPIYVDPNALRRAGKTLKSPVKGLPPDPQRKITFRQKLRSVLEPMGLAYEVKDGAILITTPDAVENPDIEEPEDEGIAPWPPPLRQLHRLIPTPRPINRADFDSCGESG